MALLYSYVTPRRIELRFNAWKASVLTVRRWGRLPPYKCAKSYQKTWKMLEYSTQNKFKEAWLRGWRRTTRNRVRGKPLREFESPRFRNDSREWMGTIRLNCHFENGGDSKTFWDRFDWKENMSKRCTETVSFESPRFRQENMRPCGRYFQRRRRANKLLCLRGRFENRSHVVYDRRGRGGSS